MKVYLLYYDTDYGGREEWNTFYTPVEVFSTEEKRAERIEFLKKTPSLMCHTVDEELDPDPTTLSGHEED